MLKQQLPKITSLREMILEYNFGPKSDMSTELVPSRITFDQRVFQSLLEDRSIFFLFHFDVTRYNNSHLVERLQRLDTHTRSIVLLFRFDQSIFKFFQGSTLSRHTHTKKKLIQITQGKKKRLTFFVVP